MKKLLCLITLLLISLTLGCNRNGSSNTQGKVVFAGSAVGQDLELAKQAVKNFEKDYPRYKGKIEVLETPDLADDRYGLYLQYFATKSSKIDIIMIDVIWPGDLSEHLIDLNKYGAKKYTDKYFSEIVKNNTVDNRLVGLPWFTDAGLLYYRKDLLKKYNLDVPQTWSELEKAAKIIQDGERKAGNQDFHGFVWQGKPYEGLTCNALEWIATHNGGRIINRNKVITVNNPNAIKAIQRVKNWIGSISPKAVLSYAEEDCRKIWESGNAAFMRNWPYCWSLGNQKGKVIAGKFDVAPIPKAKGGKHVSTLGGWQIAVSKYSDNKKLAAKFALYIASLKEQKIRAIKGSKNPTIKSLYQDKDVIKAAPFLKKLYKVFTNTVPRPSTVGTPNYNRISQKFYETVYKILKGRAEAKAAFKNLELDLQEITGFNTGKPK